jgi:heme-degrading monooxygenase HmoA
MLFVISALSATLAACADDKDQGGNDLQSCVEDDFVGQPLAGRGYNPDQGLTGPLQDSYIASTTFLILNPDQTARFEELTGALAADLQTREGLVAVGFGQSQKCGTVRTLAVWASEQAMTDFVLGDAHAAAMAEVSVVGLNGAVTHWEVTPDEIPMSWELARTKIAAVEAIY